MRPRIARAQAGRSWSWELLVFVTCRVSCRHEQRKGGRCREIGGRVGAECAPFEGGWRTLRTHRPDPATAVTPVMQRRLGGKRWEKLSQRIMSREREALRVCQLSHYICRDCIRSYVLVSNGEIGGVSHIKGKTLSESEFSGLGDFRDRERASNGCSEDYCTSVEGTDCGGTLRWNATMWRRGVQGFRGASCLNSC